MIPIKTTPPPGCLIVAGLAAVVTLVFAAIGLVSVVHWLFF